MIEELIRIRGIGPTAAERLMNAGVKSVEEIAHSKPEESDSFLRWSVNEIFTIIQNAKELLNLERGIQNVLNSIKENFAKSCPKCGSNMVDRFIILSPTRRINTRQCTMCKFYMPK